MTVTFEREDINAVANSRYFRKTGQRYLTILAIVILGLAMVFNYSKGNFPFPAYIAACGVSAIIFLYKYAKGQRAVRKALWKMINEKGVDTDGAGDK